VEARIAGVELLSWVRDDTELLRDLLAAHGAVLVSGMTVDTHAFGASVSAVAGAPLSDYVNRSTPRTRVSGQVFTSTEYSASLPIPHHNEQSYTKRWPKVLGFWCEQRAAIGGATPLAPADRVLESLPAALVASFEAAGVCYERWCHPHLDLPWQEVFQTSCREDVEEWCARHGVEAHWEGEALRTREVAQATVEHRGRRQWFNQAALFHPAALPPGAEDALRASVGDRLPRNALFGSGEPIPREYVAAIGQAYARAAWSRPWATDDVLFVDNVAVAHGREPYEGERRVLVAMAGAGGSGQELPR
jgi:hypothetical protein